MLSFRQIFAAVPSEQQFDAVEAKNVAQTGEPLLLEADLLSQVSGGATSIPVGGW